MVLGSEFGRIPRINDKNGRDCRNQAFRCLMAADLSPQTRIGRTPIHLSGNPPRADGSPRPGKSFATRTRVVELTHRLAAALH